jgi:conjugal transfer pilus assembly protein TraW
MWSSDPPIRNSRRRARGRARAARLAFAALVALPAPSVFSRTPDDAGIVGPVYPIGEPDALRTIEATLREKQRTGELARLEREGMARAQASLTTPRPVPGLRRTVTPRVHHVDPSVHVARDVLAPDGATVIRAGTSVNPLDHVQLPSRLLFFDARDAAQVAHAVRLIDRFEGRVKPILVGGSFAELMRRWQRPVYYDQGGALVQRLGIRQVPALVSQEGRRLRVEELAP